MVNELRELTKTTKRVKKLKKFFDSELQVFWLWYFGRLII